MSPTTVLAFYFAASLVTFLAYGLDKSAARSGRRRIRERTLLLLGLAGGWPGALLAQRTFRHKTVKQPFRVLFLASVVVNCCGLLIYASPTGSSALFPFMS